MTQLIIPPVDAGTIESSLQIEYDHDRLGHGGFEATSEHVWEFDSRQFSSATGLDIGGDTYVHQENGHSLRVETAYTFSRSTYNDTVSYTLSMDLVGYRGTYNRDAVYITSAGFIELDENHCGMAVTDERPRHGDDTTTVSAELLYDDVVDEYYRDGEALVRQLHEGFVGPTVREYIRKLIACDSPDDAVAVETYKHQRQLQAD